jgi:hypothetical protein
MDTPRGYNPIGQSAPGLPRHDAQIPGHVPGSQFPNIGGGDASPPSQTGLNPAYAGPGLPDWCTKPIARVLFFFWLYLTAPIEAALYPIAGAAGLACGGLFYLIARAMGGGYDTTHGWAWAGCFIGVVALMRTDIRVQAENPAYRRLRGWLRLGLSFAFMLFFTVSDQDTSFGKALIVAAVFTGMVFLVLRSKYLRFVWHALQHISWMRPPAEPLMTS